MDKILIITAKGEDDLGYLAYIEGSEVKEYGETMPIAISNLAAHILNNGIPKINKKRKLWKRKK